MVECLSALKNKNTASYSRTTLRAGFLTGLKLSKGRVTIISVGKCCRSYELSDYVFVWDRLLRCFVWNYIIMEQASIS